LGLPAIIRLTGCDLKTIKDKRDEERGAWSLLMALGAAAAGLAECVSHSIDRVAVQ
jgi:hypothetical protein